MHSFWHTSFPAIGSKLVNISTNSYLEFTHL